MGKTTETDIQMRFADADSLGHINNVNLMHYFDVGKMDFYAKVIGKDVSGDSESLVLVATNTSYFAQTRLYDKVYIETSVEKIGTKSVSFYQRLIDRRSGIVNAECRTVAVAFDFKKQESIELLPQWREAFKEYLAS